MTLHPAPNNFIWNEESPIKFQMALTSDKIQEKIRSFLNSSIIEFTSTNIEKKA